MKLITQKRKKEFAITMYNTACKVMIQGTHRQFWASNEFPLLFRIADEVLTKGRSYSDAYMICTGCKVDINGIDLIPCDHEVDSDDDERNNLDVARCATPGYNVQSVECLDEVNSSDESLLEFRIKNTNKTRLRKRSKTGRTASSPRSSNKKKVLKKAGLSKKPAKCAPQSKDNLIITQRLNNLEDALCKVESNYANETAKVFSTEQAIKSVVSSKFMELVRDLKDQHKHQLNLINDEMKSMREEYELQIKTLKSSNESLKGRLASVNDTCNNLEKRVKDLKVDNCELSNKFKNFQFKVKSAEAEVEINKGNCLRTLENIRDEFYKQERVKQLEEIREVINNTSEISEKLTIHQRYQKSPWKSLMSVQRMTIMKFLLAVKS